MRSKKETNGSGMANKLKGEFPVVERTTRAVTNWTMRSDAEEESQI